jgi:hypothetical protein
MNSPTKGDMGCFCQKRKVTKGDDKKLCKGWKQRIFKITKYIKNQLWMSVQIQKQVPQCNMAWPGRV